MSRPDRPARLLVAAHSGRALACSARRAGIEPVVADAFGDRDTRACAAAARVVPSGPRGLDSRALAAAAAALPAGPGDGVVYGGGVRPGAVEALSRHRRLYGNPPAVMRAVSDPSLFFGALDELGVRYPPIRLDTPVEPSGWLVKDPRRDGGGHVRPLGAGEPVRAGTYLQRRRPGTPVSVIFLADGRRARVLGYSTLWTTRLPARPYQYAGAVNRAPVRASERERLAAVAQWLTARFGLIGLNGLDVLVGPPGEPALLELNPRPGGAFELYDAELPEGLLALHLDACRGRLPAGPLPGGRVVRGYEVVYAPCAIEWRGEPWPQWCRDRPAEGTRVIAGEPLCTVHAGGVTPAAVKAGVRERRARLLGTLAREARRAG